MRRSLPLSSAIKQPQSLPLEGEGDSPKASGVGVDASLQSETRDFSLAICSRLTTPPLKGEGE